MRCPIIIRPETSNDHASIERLLLAAFANHPYSHQTEHFIVHELRAAGALTVSLVAEIEGRVVGHIAFSPILIDGRDSRWYGVGPLSVLPEHQRQGVGKALMKEGLEVMRRLGAEGCVLVGDPNYYQRFGFTQPRSLMLEGVPAENFMSLQLSGDMPRGQVTFHAAFFATA